MEKGTTTRSTTTRSSAARSRRKPSSRAGLARAHSPSHDEIALRAFELYRARGDVPGDEVSDWLQAEAELHAHARM